MMKLIPALITYVSASKFSYENYDSAWYGDYVTEYKGEHGHDPSYTEPPHEEMVYYGNDEHHVPEEHYGDVPHGDFYN